MITENLSTLKINKLTQEQYDRELLAGNLKDNELYLTPDEECVTKEEFDNTVGNVEALLDNVISEQESIIAMQNSLIGGGSE